MLDGGLDVGPSPGEVDSLLAFVDRLGADGTDGADGGDSADSADEVVTRAQDRVRRAARDGAPPPGLQRLAQALDAAGTELAPLPRRPTDDPGSLVAAVRDTGLIVLDGVGPADLGAAVAALVDDGRRVIVTAADADALAAVRAALPARAADRVVPALPALAPADLHRLRTLLATSTPARRNRLGQYLPDLTLLPEPADVAELSAVAARTTPPGTELVAPLLADLDDDRRQAVVSVAQCVQRSLTTLGTHHEPWVWELLGDLVHGRRRQPFDALVQSAASALATIDDGRDDPPVRITGPLPEDAVATLVAYLEFRESGGRTRGPFRSAAQRDVEPVLRHIRVGDHRPETGRDLRIVLTHFELGERLVTVDADCARMDLPTPQTPTELAALSSALVAVAAAARSVGALRHDMLFLGSTSPVSVPDVAAAEELAFAVLDYEENGSAAEAGEILDGLADEVASLAPPGSTAPEHARAVAALRTRDAAAYATAAEELIGAYRERYDEQRIAAFLPDLGPPELAREWRRGAFGLAWFTPADVLLDDLPDPDRADVVVVVDAARLGADRALLAAAAPRMVVAAAGGRAGAATLLGQVQRAAPLVIQGRPAGTAGRVVPLTPGARPSPLVGHGEVEQAGA